MKTILLFDPRFPLNNPRRLTVADELASAAVRAGVAAAANSSESGALAAGAPLSQADMTEVVMQHGLTNTALARVFVPLSVALVGAALGILAPVGRQLGGVVPTPSLTLSGPLSFTAGSAAGTLVANIGGVPAGVTPTITPNDGRLAVAGDQTNGWKVVVGLSASTAGTIALSVAAAGATGASATVTVNAAAGLPTFTLQPETLTAVSAIEATGTPVNARRRYMLDRWIKALKAAGTWAKLTHLYFPTEVQAHSLINLKNPGTGNLTVVGSPTFASPRMAVGGADPLGTAVGWKSTGTAHYLDTGIALSSVPQNSFSIGVFRTTAAASGSSDFGARDGTAGIALAPLNNVNSNTMSARMMSASIGVNGTTADWDGTGFHAATRSASNAVAVYKGPRKVSTATTTSVASTSSTTLRFLAVPGDTAASSAGILGGFFGAAMTDAEMEMLYRAYRGMADAVFYGDPDLNDPGYAVTTSDYDLLVYGVTFRAVCAAYEAKRQGIRVAMIGAWNDYTVLDIGGISANGLGAIDLSDSTSLGGLPYEFIKRAQKVDGSTDTVLNFQPVSLNRVLRQALDPVNSGGQAIPIFFTGGAPTSASLSNGKYTVATADGRSFTGKIVHDCSDEGDILALLGVPLFTGREIRRTSGGGGEITNGYRGVATDYKGNVHQFAKNPNVPGTLYDIDPFVVPGDTSSGFVAGVKGYAPSIAEGSADSAVQAYNFRWTMRGVSAKARWVPWSQVFASGAPEGYSAAKYELVGRLCAAMTADNKTAEINDFFNPILLNKATLDTNNTGGFSTDLMGSGTAYVAAGQDMAARLAVYKAIRANMLGLVYHIINSGDARIPSSFVTTLRDSYGVADDHYYDVGPNGVPYFPGQLYVREFRRMVGGIGGAKWDANDAIATDGTTPRISTNTVAAVAYPMDSHHNERYAVPKTGGGWRVWNEGNFFDNRSGGADNKTPLPFEVCCPDKSVAPNVGTAWSIATTHVSWGGFRMEGFASQVGQSLGLAAAIAIEQGIALQDVPYATLRSRLLATPEAVPPVIPQVN